MMGNLSEKIISKPLYYLGIVGLATAVVSGCSSTEGNKTVNGTQGSSSTPQKADTPSPEANTTSSTTSNAPAVTLSNTNSTTPTFGQPLVESKNTGESVQIAAGLIPPTNGNDYVRNISKGRPDPFSILPVQPIVNVPKGTGNGSTANAIPTNRPQVSSNNTSAKANLSRTQQPQVNAPEITAKSPLRPEQVAKKPVSKVGNSGDLSNNQGTAAIAGKLINPSVPIVAKAPTKEPRKVSQPIAKMPAISPKPIPTQPIVATRSKLPPIMPVGFNKPLNKPSMEGVPTAVVKPIPPAPTAKLAQTITVNGVVEIDGKTQVLVTLPNETYSRYLDVGSTLFDGQVRIKRVDHQSITPIVVFEEAGIEISRRVGDKPIVASK